MHVSSGAKGSFTDCTFHHNEYHGLYAEETDALVELHGEQTEIHNNTNSGLFAESNATINIYIPLRPITAVSHDNEGEGDLGTWNRGKIQSQLSSTSLELTVIHHTAP